MPIFGTKEAVEWNKELANESTTKDDAKRYLNIALNNAEKIKEKYVRENYIKLIKDNIVDLDNIFDDE